MTRINVNARRLIEYSLFFIATVSVQYNAQAWGERGHHDICYVATLLVKDPNLKTFLQTRGHIMGHVCNIPDIYWRDLPNTQVGNPTHFMQPDSFGISIKDSSANLADFVTQLKAAPPTTPNQTLGDKLTIVGGSWWRAEQFANLAVAAGKIAATSPPPQNSTQQQSYSLPYNKAVYDMMTNMGLMGHFVGDASMPYHNWGDYDGYGTGHGGIHYYYETSCVATYGLKLAYLVEQAAKSFEVRKFSTYPEAVKHISELSVQEVSTVEKLDKTIAPSSVKTNLGMTVQTPAVRPPFAQQCPKFLPLIIVQMSRSAKTLAALWDKVYADAGRPPLAAYVSYDYPLEPAFVTPDYLNPYMGQ